MGTIFLWLITGIQGIFLPILEYFGKRAVIYATVVTAFIALTGVLATFMQQMISAVASGSISDPWNMAIWIGLLFPANFTLCVSIIINTILAKASYDYMITLYGLSKT